VLQRILGRRALWVVGWDSGLGLDWVREASRAIVGWGISDGGCTAVCCDVHALRIVDEHYESNYGFSGGGTQRTCCKSRCWVEFVAYAGHGGGGAVEWWSLLSREDLVAQDPRNWAGVVFVVLGGGVREKGRPLERDVYVCGCDALSHRV